MGEGAQRAVTCMAVTIMGRFRSNHRNNKDSVPNKIYKPEVYGDLYVYNILSFKCYGE